MTMARSPVAEGEAATAAPASYLLADRMPASPSDVLRFAASTYGRPPPQAVAYEEVAPRLSAPARSFWGAPKRISAEAVFDSLGVHLAYPTYVKGLQATSKAARSRRSRRRVWRRRLTAGRRRRPTVWRLLVRRVLRRRRSGQLVCSTHSTGAVAWTMECWCSLTCACTCLSDMDGC